MSANNGGTIRRTGTISIGIDTRGQESGIRDQNFWSLIFLVGQEFFLGLIDLGGRRVFGFAPDAGYRDAPERNQVHAGD